MSDGENGHSSDKLINVPIILFEEDVKFFREVRLSRVPSLSKSRSVGNRIEESVSLLDELAQDHFDDGVGKKATLRAKVLRDKVRIKKSTQVYIRKYMRRNNIESDKFAWLTRYLFLESREQS